MYHLILFGTLAGTLTLLSPPSFGELTRESIYQKIKRRLTKAGRAQKFSKGQNYYHFGFSTHLPRDYSRSAKDQIWTSDEIMYFSNPQGKVTQVALVSKKCGVKNSSGTLAEIREQAKAIVARETQSLWGETLKIPDSSFQQLGPHSEKWTRVRLPSRIEGVRKIRLGRGLYKCDGQTGYGFRTDLFL